MALRGNSPSARPSASRERSRLYLNQDVHEFQTGTRSASVLNGAFRRGREENLFIKGGGQSVITIPCVIGLVDRLRAAEYIAARISADYEMDNCD